MENPKEKSKVSVRTTHSWLIQQGDGKQESLRARRKLKWGQASHFKWQFISLIRLIYFTNKAAGAEGSGWALPHSQEHAVGVFPTPVSCSPIERMVVLSKALFAVMQWL